MSDKIFEVFPKVILRTPQYPLDLNVSKESIFSFFSESAAGEALYLASPNLYKTYLRWKNGEIKDAKKEERLIVSLTKYYLRMHSRCTPFGLFASLNEINWAGEQNEILLDSTNINRYTRLDMDLVANIATQLERIPAIKKHLLFYPNSSIYQYGEELRFVEHHIRDNKRSHQISAVGNSEYLQEILNLSKHGATIKMFAGLLCDDEITEEDVNEFIDELIANQIIVSELEGSVTGQVFLDRILDLLKKIYEKGKEENVYYCLSKLSEIKTLLGKLDEESINEITLYEEIVTKIKALDIPYKEGNIFHVDSRKKINHATLNEKLQKDLWTGLEVLKRLASKQEIADLKDFKEKFVKRYEGKEIPLLNILDNENGIGFGNGKPDDNPLSRDLYVVRNGEAETEVKINKIQKWVSTKMLHAIKNGDFEVKVTDKELEQFPLEWDDMPPSFSTMFRLVEEDKILIELAGQSSALNLLARFSQGDKGLEKSIKRIAHLEQELNEDVVFAEIAHLPANRVSNVLQRPILRAYEIPFLAKSSLAKERQILLQDLYVSVVGNRIVLKSKRLNKEIIPRLSSAHNFDSNHTQPLYRFLGSLQFQHFKSFLMFDWGIPGFDQSFFPRLTYKNVILSPALWHIKKKEFEFLLKNKDNLKEKIEEFQEQNNLPQLFTLTEFDNELLVNTGNILTVKCFISAIKNKSSIQLKEVLLDKSAIVKNEKGQVYNNQFIASIVKQKPSFANLSPAIKQGSHESIIKTDFPLGSEWVYFKIYCGTKTIDQLLVEVVDPLVEQLKEESIIDKWFFIRYYDPEPHLRLRFLLKDKKHFGDLMSHFAIFEEYLENGLVWNIQADTYKREVRRYGVHTMEDSETLFGLGSECIIEFLKDIAGYENQNIRWLWSMRATDELLHNFGFSIAEKLKLMEKTLHFFQREFNVNKVLRAQLKSKYREHKSELENIIKADYSYQFNEIPVLRSIQNHTDKGAVVFKTMLDKKEEGLLDVPLDNLTSSYIHMLLNRLLPSYQRKQELVIYDFFVRYYKSEIAKRTYKQAAENPVEQTS